MKASFPTIALVTLLCLGGPAGRADLEVTADVRVRAVAEFHAPLATHGTWVEVGGHGRCWRPSGVAVGWRPYSEGHWIWTDCGWYWVSDEPWAWACYHYGTWALDPTFGWIWVPGIEWAPAWVSWRVGGGYCGWAPRPPRGVVLRPSAFVFVEERRFHEPVRANTVIINNPKILKQTKVIHKERRESRNIGGTPRTIVFNEGPGRQAIEQASGRPLRQTPVQEAARQTFRQRAASQMETAPRVPPEKPKLPDAKTPDGVPPTTPPPPPQPLSPPGNKESPGLRPDLPTRPRTDPPSIKKTDPPTKPSVNDRGRERGRDKERNGQ